MSYDEFGLGSLPAGEPYGFTGRRYDPETGLYYYRARYYSPQLGRFLQVDPLGYKDDLDLYAYVTNDPLDKTDPTGEDFRSFAEHHLQDLVTVGEALAADTAYAVGKLTGDEALAQTAIDSMAANHDRNVNMAIVFATTTRGGRGGGRAGEFGATEGAPLSQRAATRAAKRETGIPTSQQSSSQTNLSVNGTKVGRQQSFNVPKPGGGTQQKSVQVSRDIRGAHKDQPQIEAGTIKPGGQTDAAGRPRIQNDDKVRIDFLP